MNYTRQQIDKAVGERELSDSDYRLSKILTYELGFSTAFLLQEIKSWCESNENTDNQFYFKRGYWWTKMSFPEIAYHYPMLGSIATIKRLVKELEGTGLLISDNSLNPDKQVRTKWYRVNSPKITEIVFRHLTNPPPNSPTKKWNERQRWFTENPSPTQTDSPEVSKCDDDLFSNYISNSVSGIKQKYNADAKNVFFDANAKREQPIDLGVEASEAIASTAKKIGEPEPANISLVKNQDLGKEGSPPPTPPRTKKPRLKTDMFRNHMASGVCDEVRAIYNENKPQAWGVAHPTMLKKDRGYDELYKRISEYEDLYAEHGYDIFKRVYAKTLQGMQNFTDFYKNNSSIGIYKSLLDLGDFSGKVISPADMALLTNTNYEAESPRADKHETLAKNILKSNIKTDAIDDLVAHLHPRNNQHLGLDERGKLAKQYSETSKHLDGIYRAIAPTLDDDILLDKEKLKAVLSSEMSAAA